jgi:hypothetical protein
LVVFGALSVGAIVMQFLQLQSSGSVTPLPLALSPFGIQALPADGWYPLGPGNRVLGAFQEANLTGSFATYVACLALPTAVHNESPTRRALALALVTAAAVAVWASASRQAMLVLAVIVTIVALRNLRERPAIAVLAIGMLLGAGLYVYRLLSLLAAAGVDAQTAVALSRLSAATQTGDISGGRFEWYQRLFSELDEDTFLLGRGEGAAFSADVVTAHNAFLVVLFENGLWALLLLVVALAVMLRGALADQRNRQAVVPRAWAEAGPLIVVTWILLIGINWAQMNQVYIWPFLTFAFVGLIAAGRPVQIGELRSRGVDL